MILGSDYTSRRMHHRGPRYGGNLSNTAIATQRTIHKNSDLSRRHRRKHNLTLDEIIACNAAARHRHPVRIIEVLYVEAGQAILCKGQRVCGFDGIRIIILQRVDVDLVDRLLAAKIDLEPVGLNVLCSIIPSAAIAPI